MRDVNRSFENFDIKMWNFRLELQAHFDESKNMCEVLLLNQSLYQYPLKRDTHYNKAF